ncbi:MAG: DUF1819 family protein [Gordonibacter sp.]|uniref:BrxA family protein n=1 Tax=Gordonibacter sp. TaxID=1968902 RepID=UPI002FC9EB55
MISNKNKYCLSLTGAGTYRAEALEAARAYLECQNWREVRHRIVDEDLLSLNSEGNRKRIGGEVIKRLKTLTLEETAFFVSSVDDDQLAMLWVAFCRTYPILRSFSSGVLSVRYRDMIPDVPKETYRAFVEDEEYDHPELAALTESSQKKIEIRIYGMLRDCRLIGAGFNITPLYPSEAFAELIRANSPEDLLLFPKVGALL